MRLLSVNQERMINSGWQSLKSLNSLAGFDLSNIGPDRPLTPDGHSLLIEFWNAGMSIEDIMQELRLSEARVCAELLFLAIKGRIEQRVKRVS